jgi:hypothetical protein
MAEDMLFATLDPTLRTVRLPGGRPAILSDTVGFISDLPHELVEAFRATLEEVQEADVILHVRDIANPDSRAQAHDVEAVLEQIKLGRDSDRVLIEVWNKVDVLDEESRGEVLSRALRSEEGVGILAVAVSAVTGEGMERLRQVLADHVDTGEEATISLTYADGQALAWLYRHGRDRERFDSNINATSAPWPRYQRLHHGVCWLNADRRSRYWCSRVTHWGTRRTDRCRWAGTHRHGVRGGAVAGDPLARGVAPGARSSRSQPHQLGAPERSHRASTR